MFLESIEFVPFTRFINAATNNTLKVFVNNHIRVINREMSKVIKLAVIFNLNKA